MIACGDFLLLFVGVLTNSYKKIDLTIDEGNSSSNIRQAGAELLTDITNLINYAPTLLGVGQLTTPFLVFIFLHVNFS